MAKVVVDPLNEIIKRITNTIDPEKIILFGSRAKYDTLDTDRDYDIFILLEGKYNKRKICHKIYKVLFGVGVSVDIIIENPRDFEKLKENKFMVYYQIAKEGKVIYEK